MKKNVLKILSSIVLGTCILSNFAACGNTNSDTKTTQEQKKEESGRHSRTPQVNSEKLGDKSTTSSSEKIYKDGEVVTLADGSKIKYNENGDHEILEKGQGKVIIFKNVTESELESLTDSQRSLVKRQMKNDPKGFSVIY